MGSNNRVALVTGGGHGIGKAISQVLALDGLDVIICGHNEEHLTSALSEIRSHYGKKYAFKVDVTRPEEVKQLFSESIARIGALDAVVNNVGRAQQFGSFFDLKDEDWLNAWNLNFMSAVYVIREALPWLRKSKVPRIINISSVPARQPGLFNPHYSAAKAALVNLSKHLANTLAADGILVNAICPGTLRGGGWERNAADRAARLGISQAEAEQGMEAEEKLKVPLGKVGMPEDVAELVSFLASDKAKFITGTCINVDGGVTRAIF